MIVGVLNRRSCLVVLTCLGLMSGCTADGILVLEGVRLIGGDGDTVLDPGETVTVLITLYNFDSEDARNVTLELRSNHSGVTVITGEVGCGTIGPGDAVTCPGIQVTAPLQATDSEYSLVARVDAAAVVTSSFPCAIPAGKSDASRNDAPKAAIHEVTILDHTGSEVGLSPGASAKLRVRLFSGGGSALLGAVATLSSPDGSLVISGQTAVTCGNIPSGASAWCDDVWTIDVPVSVTTEAHAQLTVSDASGIQWTESFTLPVADEAPDPQVVGWTVTGDANADGMPNPGESGQLSLVLFNQGLLALTGATVTVTSTGLASLSDTPLECPLLPSGGTIECGALSFRPLAQAGVAALVIDITDAAGRTWRRTLDLPVPVNAGRPVVVGVDGALVAGAAAPLVLRLRNAGTSLLPGTFVSLTTTAAGLTVAPGEVSCGSIPPARAVTCEAIAVTAGDTLPDAAPATLELETANGERWTLDVTLPLPATN